MKWKVEALDPTALLPHGDAVAFDELTAALRATEEWRYVVHEVEVRLRRPTRPG